MTQPCIGVLGGEGFIGSAVAAELTQRGVDVRLLPRVPPGSDVDALAAALAPALSGLDAVVNAAGRAQPDTTELDDLRFANSTLPLVVAMACELAGVKRIVHVSSAAVQGNRQALDSSNDMSAVSAYAKSKADGEAALADFASASPIEVCRYRATSVQGADRATTRRLAKRLSRRVVPIVGDGLTPIPVTSAAATGRLIAALACAAGPLPAVVTHPWEGVTQRDLVHLLADRPPSWAVPSRVVRLALISGSVVVKRVPRLRGPWRRLEFAAQGQRVATSDEEHSLFERIGFVVDHDRVSKELADIGRSIRRSQSAPGTERRLFMLSELYWPETTSTGHTMTLMAEAIARVGPVTVLTVPPTYSQTGTTVTQAETRNGVEIVRLSCANPGRSTVPRRAISGIVIAGSILSSLARRCGRDDTIVVVSNPPVLPYGAWLIARFRRARVVLVTHDLFPDILVAAGMFRPSNPVVRVARALSRRLYCDATLIVAIGEAQAARIRSIAGLRCAPIEVVSQAADLDLVGRGDRSEADFDLGPVEPGTLVVQIAGNLGPLQDTDAFAEALTTMEIPHNVLITLVGSGGSRSRLERLIEEHGLASIRVLDPLPRSEVGRVHQACDAALVMLKPGMVGVSVPSRIGNVLASGKPVIAMTGQGSELSQLVSANGLGWVVDPGDWRALEATLHDLARCDATHLDQLGERCRAIAERLYSPAQMRDRYEHIFSHHFTGAEPRRPIGTGSPR